MNQKQFGFGIIGTGTIAHFHAKAIAEIKNAMLKGVYNRTKEKAEKFAVNYGGVVYDSLHEMLRNKEIDVVCICTPSGAHLEPALESIAAGKHCLIEKPLEITVGRCNTIIEKAQEKGVKISVIFPSRFNEGISTLKKAVEDQRFGNYVLGNAYVKWHRTPDYYQSGKWRGTWELDGGGALMNQGIHSIDLLQWLMGPVSEVKAFSTNTLHKEIEVEDTLVAILKFKNGALGTVECTTAGFPGDPKRIEVRGSQGTAVLEEDKLINWKFEQEKEEDKVIRENSQLAKNIRSGFSNPTDIGFKGHQMQIEDVIESIKVDNEPLITAKEGKKSVEIIEAIYKSARTDKCMAVSTSLSGEAVAQAGST